MGISTRVLVAVGDPVLGLRIAMDAPENGCTVDLAGTPARARELAARRTYEAIVVDLHLLGGEASPVLLTIAPPPGEDRRRAMAVALEEILEGHAGP